MSSVTVLDVDNKTKVLNSWLPKGFFATAEYQGNHGKFDGWQVYRERKNAKKSTRPSCFAWVRTTGINMMGAINDLRPKDLEVMRILEEKIPKEFGIPIIRGFVKPFEANIKAGKYHVVKGRYSQVTSKRSKDGLKKI